MFEAPVGFAFAAGMATLMNPCGAAMLPAYIGYHLGQTEAGANPVPVIARGLRLGLVATAGFIFLFGLFGVVISAGGQALVEVMPMAGLVVGVGVVLLGLYLLVTRRHLGIMAAGRVSSPSGGGSWKIFLFGIAYAVASLSCALPIFLIVVVGSLAANGFVAALAAFISYGLGMGAMLIVITLAVVVSKGFTIQLLRRVFRYVERVGALTLVAAGSYIIYYWTLGTGGRQLLFA